MNRHDPIDPPTVGEKLKIRRQQCGLTLRGLASRAGVTASFISMIEAGKTSPTIITLQKILEAMNVTVAEFFSEEKNPAVSDAIVFRHEDMKVLGDDKLLWRFALPPEPDIRMVISYEEYQPGTGITEVEWHNTDIGGYVLSGELTIEIQGRGMFIVGTGDAFYLKAGVKHIANNTGTDTVRMVTTLLK